MSPCEDTPPAVVERINGLTPFAVECLRVAAVTDNAVQWDDECDWNVFRQLLRAAGRLDEREETLYLLEDLGLLDMYWDVTERGRALLAELDVRID